MIQQHVTSRNVLLHSRRLVTKIQLATSLVVCAVVLMVGPLAYGTTLETIVDIYGASENKVVGMGLVVGLPGTGDGSISPTTRRIFAQLFSRLGDANAIADEMEIADNVAVVYITGHIPSDGVLPGEKIRVSVSAPFASSLEGGRLMMSPLLWSDPDYSEDPADALVYAKASGPLVVDKKNPTNASIRFGGKMTVAVMPEIVDTEGNITLIIKSAFASYRSAEFLAGLINDGPQAGLADDEEGERSLIAWATSSKNITVRLPAMYRDDPSYFLSDLMGISFESSLIKQRPMVVINRITETIVITGGVEFNPASFSHKDVSITSIEPNPPATEDDPKINVKSVVIVDPGATAKNNLKDLVAAFNEWQLPASEQIEIVMELFESGSIFADVRIVE